MSNILEAYVASNDQVLLARAGDRFVPLSPVTEWYRALWPEGPLTTGVSIFLDHFIEEAEEYWGQELTTQLSSGPFIETIRGEEFPLEARALKLSGRAVLLIHHLGQGFEDQQQLLIKLEEKLKIYIDEKFVELEQKIESKLKKLFTEKLPPLELNQNTHNSELVEQLD